MPLARDLTKADEATIQACDTAYDAAKQQAKNAEFRERSRSEKAAKIPSPESNKPSYQRLKIQLDIDLARLSHILALKEVFRSHSGEIPIEISLMTGTSKVSGLHIDKSWGVDHHRELERKISTLPSVKRVVWE